MPKKGCTILQIKRCSSLKGMYKIRRGILDFPDVGHLLLREPCSWAGSLLFTFKHHFIALRKAATNSRPLLNMNRTNKLKHVRNTQANKNKQTNKHLKLGNNSEAAKRKHTLNCCNRKVLPFTARSARSSKPTCCARTPIDQSRG